MKVYMAICIGRRQRQALQRDRATPGAVYLGVG